MFWDVRVYWGASSDSRYSETRRGIGTSGGIGGPRGCEGNVLGVSGMYWGLVGTLGTQGPEGV